MNRITFIVVFFLAFVTSNFSDAQIVVNEISNRNSGQVLDGDNEVEDWIELFNASDSVCNLLGYYLSDDSAQIEKWGFSSYDLKAGEHLLVFASGKNKFPEGSWHWESAVLPEHNFSYTVPSDTTPANWKHPDFIPVEWNAGKAGIGYGDEDDSSVVSYKTLVVYARDSFLVPEDFRFADVVLHVDYDDGFIAWLNGVEIARSNIEGDPAWNSPAASNHEAMMYSGGLPESFFLDTAFVNSLLLTGKNVLAIEVHNVDSTSSDLSLIPFLSFLIDDSLSVFEKSPSWLLPTKLNSFHTNFKISGSGEKIYLSKSGSGVFETVWVHNLDHGWSLGRETDGADIWGIFIQPTPSQPNNTKLYSMFREPEPIFSVAEGFFPGEQSVFLSSSSPSSEIHYTLDGSEPDRDSPLFDSAAIVIPTSKVLRAICFSTADTLQSRSVANSYFINNTMHSLPVLSVITNSVNLYGTEGIFDNWFQEWERPCYVEYFDALGKKEFEQFSGIQIDGGAGGSRSNPQHSFRLEFGNNLYGDEDLEYPLFADRTERDDYKSVYLRNGSNQWLTFPFKDAMQCKIAANNTFNYYSASTPAVVYINGSYFGLYDMREKLNDQYFEKNYQANVDSAFHLLSLSYYYNSVLRALNGSVDTFFSDYERFLTLDPSDSVYLEKADEILDIDYYTDYIIAQSWMTNTDWPYNNIKIVNGDFTDYRWRFILQDLEWGLNPNGWTDYYTDHIKFMLDYSQDVPYLRFWKEMIKSPKYKNSFINRFADIMNSYYLPAETFPLAQAVYDSSFSEMRSEYVLWGGGESQADGKMIQYASNMSYFLSDLNKRSNVVRSNILKNFSLSAKYTIELQVQPENAGTIGINTIFPKDYPWQGVYFAGVPVRMEAKGSGNYVFDAWEPNNFIQDVNNPVIEADVKTNGHKFVARFKRQIPEQAVTISEINYRSTDVFPSTDWVELHNFGERSINLEGWYITDENSDHKWGILGSYDLPVDGRLVLASSISKFNNAYPGVQNVMGSFGFGLGSASDSVLLYDQNNILVAGLKYCSTKPWPTEPYDQGVTLELIDPYLDLCDPTNWFPGCIGGSPGTGFVRCDISDRSAELEILATTIFPNPAEEEINIVLSSGQNSKDIICRIYDIMGKIVFLEPVGITSPNSLKLSVSHLSEGIYIIQLSDGSNLQNLKFIKRKK